MKKVAFFTMDTESFYDTTCIQKRLADSEDEMLRFDAENHHCDQTILPDPKFSCAEEVGEFTKLAEKYKVPLTYYLNVEFLPLCKPFIKLETSNGTIKNEISLHCYKHVSPLTQTLEEFENDISLAVKNIRENFKVSPKGFRAPCFGIDEKRLEIIKNHGFIYDSSFMNTNFSIYNGTINLENYKKINSAVYEKDGFFEILPSTAEILKMKYPVSGGAYSRTPPYAFVKYALHKYLKSADGFMFYVHPFEISKRDLPLPKHFGLGNRLFINRGRKNYLERIEKIIQFLKKKGFVFMTPSQFIDEIVLSARKGGSEANDILK